MDNQKINSLKYSVVLMQCADTNEYLGRVAFERHGVVVSFDATAQQLLALSEVLLASAEKIQLHELETQPTERAH